MSRKKQTVETSKQKAVSVLRLSAISLQRSVLTFLLSAFCVLSCHGQVTQPLVAIHDSELTRALETIPATGDTPAGAGTTGYEWWTTNWHYFVMPESLKETFRSDGTAFAVVGDSNILAGALLTNGVPKYPILFSFASEAIDDAEIAAFTNYVAAGGYMVVGSSAFTRNTNGTTRGNFALATQMGINMVGTNLTNWTNNNTFNRQTNHRLVNHIPAGPLNWRLPTSSEEIPFGVSPAHPFLAPHFTWRVATNGATVLARGDAATPYLLIQPYGKGCFIYCAAMQPLLTHGGWSPGMYAYVTFRKAIEWAFETARLPVTKLSPWPYDYDAALLIRHDLENYRDVITNIESSAQFESTLGVKGDYYFCTGTLKYELNNSPPAISGLRSAVTNYGATIGSHNGGFRNPVNLSLNMNQFDYWHWGPDEALDTTPTNFPSGKSYALGSLSNSYVDIETWLTNINTGPRTWVGCYFNSTREDSLDILDQLNVKVVGEQKLGPFPHWTLSTQTPGKLYPMVSQPLSDWYLGNLVGQSLEYHSNATMQAMVDYYYDLGGLINCYSHTLSTGQGVAGAVASNYVVYAVNADLHPRLWRANALGIYDWWVQRSNVQFTVTQTVTPQGGGNNLSTTIEVTGSTSPETALELRLPETGTVLNLSVFTNGVLVGAGSYRTNGPVLKVRVGATVTNVVVTHDLVPRAVGDVYSVGAGAVLGVQGAGVLANDSAGYGGTNLSAVLVSNVVSGTLYLTNNGGFTYVPATNFVGVDCFVYSAWDGVSNSPPVSVFISVVAAGTFYSDDFSRGVGADPVLPWQVHSGNWVVTNGTLVGSSEFGSYGFVYQSNLLADVSVESRVRFQANGFGGGAGGVRLNPASGAHYAVWIYPEGSPAGSNVLKVLRFSNWDSFIQLGASVNLASVGTNFHTIKLGCQGNRLAAYFDGSLMISVLDPSPLPAGGFTAELWTYQTTHSLTFDDFSVSTLAGGDVYAVGEDGVLSVAAPGVLTNDTEMSGSSLSAVLVSSPAHGSLTLTNNGGFVYVPDADYFGGDNFTYRADDGLTNLGVATVIIAVNAVNDAPWLPAQTNRTMVELTSLYVTNAAADVDTPVSGLSYQLVAPPAGAVISTNGVIVWTPDEAQGPGTNTITTVVSDGLLSATNSFEVVVTEVNVAPVFVGTPTNRTIAELTALTVTNIAMDADVPVNALVYTLLAGPVGAMVDTNGVISWTPDESQGPGTNTITTVASDGVLGVTNSFEVVVSEVNVAPVFVGTPADRTIAELTTLTVTNIAMDADVPANILTYSLLNPPAGAAINTNGVIIWTPDESQGPTTNTITIVVSDGLTGATNSFEIVVTEVNEAPVFLLTPTNRMINPLTSLMVTNVAEDGDIPANLVSYSLLNPPDGATIDANGIIAWTPTLVQGPSTNLFVTVAQDDGGPVAMATNEFLVVVLSPPIPPVIQSIAQNTGTVTIVWSAEPGWTYRLQYKTNLSDSIWADLTPDLLASGSSVLMTNSVGSTASRFYRVYLVP